MQLTPILLGLETRVEGQLRLVDADLGAYGGEVFEALRPALRQALTEVVELAAQEVSGQLSGSRVEVRLVDGEPELVVRPDDSATPPTPPPESDEAEARLTLRLPGYLKDLVTRAAEEAGDSINSFVVDTLRSRATERQSTSSVKRVIEL